MFQIRISFEKEGRMFLECGNPYSSSFLVAKHQFLTFVFDILAIFKE